MRRDNWPSYLHAVISARQRMPFEWGAQDCVMFAAACIESVTEMNPIADLEPWDDERSAIRRISEVGGIEAWLDAHYGRIQWHEAMRGDVGVIDQESGTTVLVVNTGAEWVGPSEEGLTPSPLSAARAAWRIE